MWKNKNNSEIVNNILLLCNELADTADMIIPMRLTASIIIAY